MKTVHEGILSYMKLSENENQVGYPMLKEAADLSWYKVFKKTKEAIVRFWMPVVSGVVKWPSTLETLLGVYVVDKCGDLAALYEDNQKNIDPRPKSACSCTACDANECMCPSVQDGIVQTEVIIEDVPHTNKTHTRLLRNGEVVEQTFTWVASYNADGSFKAAVEVVAQRTVCAVETMDCGCVVNCAANAALLFNCGCVVDCDVPYLRKRYPALYNEFGYYKNDRDRREIKIFSSSGRTTRITWVKLVYQTNGSDMLIPEYARLCFTAMLDWARKMYSPFFTLADRVEAKRNYRREELDMIKFLNPLSFEAVVQASPYSGNRPPFYRGIHSDFLDVPAVAGYIPACVTPAPACVTNITNITNSYAAKLPLIGVVDRGGVNDPVSGLNTFQSDLLIGLSPEIKIEVDDQTMSSFGQNKSFDYFRGTGTIIFTAGYVWPVPEDGQPGSTLWVNLNQ